MKITAKMKTAIRAACCAELERPVKVEVGERTWPGIDTMPEGTGFNLLLWDTGHDLFQPTEMRDLPKDIPADGGWVALDCYCYVYGPNGELYNNVYVLLNPSGEIKLATCDHRGHVEKIDAILRAAGHKGYTPEDD